MNTVVIQSFREYDVPSWLSTCMGSAKAWAEQQGYTYLWKNDDFFNYATEREKRICGDQIFALTDICRLRWIADLFETYEKVIWLDADILIFSPEALNLDDLNGAGFAREVFIKPRLDAHGRFLIEAGHNNAFMFFERNDPSLQHYLEAAEGCLASWEDKELPRTIIGPILVNQLISAGDLSTIEGVGLFTPHIMREIALGGSRMSSEYLTHYSSGLCAANLCHFIRHQLPVEKRAQFDAVYEQAVARLLAIGEGALAVNR